MKLLSGLLPWCLLLVASGSSDTEEIGHGIAALRSSGYNVQQGAYDFFDLESCVHADTCYAQNPLTPYGLLFLPPSPHEVRDRFSNYCAHGICKDGLYPSWRISPGETVLLVGRTPPKSTYWSINNSLYSRVHKKGWAPNVPRDAKWASKMINACPRVPLFGKAHYNFTRCEVFAGLADPLNHLTVNVGQQESSFKQRFAMLISWDSVGESGVSAVLEREMGGFPLNSYRLPGALLRLGVNRGDEDDFISVTRLEGVAEDSERDQFYAHPDLVVFRVTPPSGTRVGREALHPSQEPMLKPRETGSKERTDDLTYQELAQALHDLQTRVSKSVRGQYGAVGEVQFDSFVQDSGYECLRQGTKCQGDCRDTIYAKATFLVKETLCNKTHAPCPTTWDSTLGKDDVLYVVGVIHSATKTSLYSSITAYDYPKLASVGVFTDKDLHGSASRWIPDLGAAQNYLYVAKFARHCARDEPWCYAIPYSSDGQKGVSPLAADSPIVFIERCYVNPKTSAAPAVDETLLPLLLHGKQGSSIAAAAAAAATQQWFSNAVEY